MIDSRNFKANGVLDVKSNFNNFLLQTIDLDPSLSKDYEVVSKIKPSEDTLRNLMDPGIKLKGLQKKRKKSPKQ